MIARCIQARGKARGPASVWVRPQHQAPIGGVNLRSGWSGAYAEDLTGLIGLRPASRGFTLRPKKIRTEVGQSGQQQQANNPKST